MKRPARKGSKRRRVTEEQEQMIVLLDGAGHFYEIPLKQLKQSKVPPERQEEVKKELRDKPEEGEFSWIHRTAVPGSIAAGAKEFDGGRTLHYAGYTLRSIPSKR